MLEHWILKGKLPCKVGLLEWAEWSADENNRHIAKGYAGDVVVSTVFLGVDHGFGRTARPVLFETMVFGGQLDGTQERYEDYDTAMAGHLALCERVLSLGQPVTVDSVARRLE